METKEYKKIICVGGKPFSGKTTISKKIQKDLLPYSSKIICSDDFSEDILKNEENNQILIIEGNNALSLSVPNSVKILVDCEKHVILFRYIKQMMKNGKDIEFCESNYKKYIEKELSTKDADLVVPNLDKLDENKGINMIITSIKKNIE